MVDKFLHGQRFSSEERMEYLNPPQRPLLLSSFIIYVIEASLNNMLQTEG